MLNSVLKHLGVSDLQVFGLAVMKGQFLRGSSGANVFYSLTVER